MRSGHTVLTAKAPPSPASGAGDDTWDQPIWAGELELYAPYLGELALPEEPAYAGARVLIRVAGTPVGFIDIGTDGHRIDLDQVAAAAHAHFADPIHAAAPTFARGSPDAAPNGVEDSLAWLAPRDAGVSVILCTRNRAAGARACVESLQRTRHPAAEIIIVDNAPSDDSTEQMVRELAGGDPRVRYVREPRPGLSVARNCGLAEAAGEIVAFTDDDVVVDSLWLNGLLRGFDRREDVACVTGIVVSASLRYPAERYFDRRVWWSSSCTPTVHDRHPGPTDSAMHPYSSGKFGTGANLAFRREAILAMGGFDNSLGAGSLTQGGEDLDAFVRLLRAGHALSYEPSAVVRHHHRVDSEALVRQMRGYGLGLGAYLTKYLLSRRTRFDLLRRVTSGLTHASALADRSVAASEDPELRKAVMRAELRGLLAGPLAYLRSRRRQDRAHIRSVAP